VVALDGLLRLDQALLGSGDRAQVASATPERMGPLL
jgi:hypothetical protein